MVQIPDMIHCHFGVDHGLDWISMDSASIELMRYGLTTSVK